MTSQDLKDRLTQWNRMPAESKVENVRSRRLDFRCGYCGLCSILEKILMTTSSAWYDKSMLVAKKISCLAALISQSL